MRRTPFGWWRLAKQVVLGAAEAVASFANSTLTPASNTGTADGSTANTLTLTLRDSNNAVMPFKAVTFTTELTAVSASQSTLVDDAAEIAATTGTLNLILVCKNADGTPLPNIQSARIVFASTGTGNTFGTPSVTDRNGQSLCTFSSTTAEAKTISVTVDGVAITQTAAVTVTGAPAVPTPLASNSWPAVGSSSANKLGSTGVTPFENQVGSPPLVSLSVVEKGAEATAESIPALNDVGFANWLRTDLTYVGGGVQNMATEEVNFAPGSTAWPIPGVGDGLYFRISKVFHYPSVSDPPALGNGNHPLEQGAGGGNSWSWTFQSSAGGFTPIFNVWVGGSATRFFLSTTLDRDVAYRFEWSIVRTATNLRETEIRIYEEDGNVLVYTTADFSTQGGSPVSLVGYSAAFGTNGVNGLDAFQVGTNGPHVVGATVGAAPAFYWGGWAVGDEWLGPWSTGQ